MSGDPPQSQWQDALQFAGAISGVGAIVYVIGATTIWVRAKLAGLPADIAFAHQPQSSVVAVGLSGIVYVVVPYGLLALAVVGVVALVVNIRNRGKDEKTFFFDVIHRAAEIAGDHPLRVAAADTVLIAGASFLSWRAFAAAIGLAAAFGGAVRWLDTTRPAKLVGTLGLILGVVVTGLGWQITNSIPVQGVELSPPLPNADHAIPYFGETSDFIYVGVVVPDSPAGVNPRRITHRIEELKRSQYLLTFNAQPFLYCRADLTPFDSVLRLLSSSTTPPKVAQC